MLNKLSLKNYPWLVDLYRKLVFSLKIKNKNYNLIINSFYKSGVNILIFSLVKWLLCIDSKLNTYCNNCLNCKLFDNNENPNFYYLKCKKKLIPSIDDIKKMNFDLLNNLFYVNLYKVVYISNINLLSNLCFNSLLKIIEEFPYKIIFIFSCYSLFNIPDTIISRCQYYKLIPPKEKNAVVWINKYLFKYTKADIITSIRLSNNSPLFAIFLLKKMWKYRLFFLRKLFYVFSMNFLEVVDLFDEECLKHNVYWLLFIFSDIIKYKLNNKLCIVNLDNINLVKFLSNKILFKNVLILIKKLFFCLNELNSIMFMNKKIFIYDLSSFLYIKVNNL